MVYDESLNEQIIIKGLPQNTEKNIILTDCMDTIISRNTTLYGILKRWSKRLGNEFGIYPNYLYKYRCEVVEGRLHNVVPIDIIYEEIAEQCIFYKILNRNLKEIFCKRAYEIEMEEELKSQSIIKSTLSFLKEQNRKGKKIYCISDFRLSSNDISRFFSNKGIDYLFEEVVSSADVGLTKKQGDLYKYVIDRYCLDTNQCVMIGDNYKSDCLNATKQGITGCWIK